MIRGYAVCNHDEESEVGQIQRIGMRNGVKTFKKLLTIKYLNIFRRFCDCVHIGPKSTQSLSVVGTINYSPYGATTSNGSSAIVIR